MTDKVCENCGLPVVPNYVGDYDTCDGEVTMAQDPYAAEIHEDYEDYENCGNGRYQSAMDI